MDKTEVIDPVCGIALDDVSNGEIMVLHGETFRFCSLECRELFERNPKRFRGTPLIELRNIWKVFGVSETKTNALSGLNMRVWRGDFVAIVGASGSGKSTALHIIGLLDRPTSGEVLLDGIDAGAASDDERTKLRSRRFGFVFQQYNLIPWLTAYENVTLPLMFSGKPFFDSDVRKRFADVGLAERMDHRPVELSGGEQQRTAFLRALANDPDIVLGDEPTGNLDSANGEKILELLIDLNRTHGKTLVVVTHDKNIASRANQILTFHDGKLIRDRSAARQLHSHA